MPDDGLPRGRLIDWRAARSNRLFNVSRSALAATWLRETPSSLAARSSSLFNSNGILSEIETLIAAPRRILTRLMNGGQFFLNALRVGAV